MSERDEKRKEKPDTLPEKGKRWKDLLSEQHNDLDATQRGENAVAMENILDVLVTCKSIDDLYEKMNSLRSKGAYWLISSNVNGDTSPQVDWQTIIDVISSYVRKAGQRDWKQETWIELRNDRRIPTFFFQQNLLRGQTGRTFRSVVRDLLLKEFPNLPKPVNINKPRS